VTVFTWLIALFTWSIPAACSLDAAAISATISVTFDTDAAISESLSFTCFAVTSPSPASLTD